MNIDHYKTYVEKRDAFLSVKKSHDTLRFEEDKMKTRVQRLISEEKKMLKKIEETRKKAG